jgi:CheY-like chemotaxis protein
MAHVIVADDDDLFRALLEEMLLIQNHKVFEAADGLEALRLCQALPVDLIVADLVMPQKDGLSMITDIRRDFPYIRIIAITGGGSVFDPEDNLDKARRLGADRTLMKPFSGDAFMSMVDELVGRS